MRWEDKRKSSNVEDRRGQQVAAGAGIGALLFRFLPFLIRSKLGRTLLIVGAVVFFGSRFLGVDVAPGLSSGGGSQQPVQLTEEQQRMGDFVAVILADTEQTWHDILGQQGITYREPKLILFTSQVNSACGMASAAVGPFYCPGDEQVYIDLSFYEDLKNRHGAPGDFAQAYVIAHEIGHHVQNILGTSEKVHRVQQMGSKVEGNKMSVKLELQADCYAGVWGYHANTERHMLDSGDLNEALVAASAIGDDRLQKQATGRVTPDSFTHGSSEQRVAWFKRGFESGDISQCDTFSGG
ncbi:KPN_02809 family neutral zinc metallopeptidase [Thalassotalea litorea]|uniref:KPN_02809 family neutral zinc metallopeptidase n=1 Tax=Thalassotalea litorea TaxID=2020715 RepID=UPI003736EA53